jgi:REP element-mobilizing transposase RayT
MILNENGKIAQQCWMEIPEHFPDVTLHEFIIMPNHIHGIVEIVGANKYSPQTGIINNSPQTGTNNGSPHSGENNCPSKTGANVYSPENRANVYSPLRSPSKTIGSVVRGFKIGVMKRIRSTSVVKTIWQRNYYEHIILNEQSFDRISEYIINNPLKWNLDLFHQK